MTNLSRALALVALFAPLDAFAQSLLTYAGGGSDDGKPATAVSLLGPRHVAVDSEGNVFVADADASLVRRIDAQTGVISTVAGNGRQGFGGDDGPATRATLRAPAGVAVDASGNVYVSDSENRRVRRVDAATGLIRTIAGGGSPADGVGDGGPATAAGLGRPDGLALDGRGGLLVADPGATRVRRVDLASGQIATVAGNGGPAGFSGDGGQATAAQLDRPSAVAVDTAGTLYIADAANNRIRRVSAGTGLIDTVAGSGSTDFAGDGGPATQAGLAYPLAIALDASGRSLDVLDTFHARVRKVVLDSGTISTVAGGGSGGDGEPATAAEIGYYPRGLFVDVAGNLYVCDGRVRKVTAATGIISTVAGGGAYVGDDLPATQALLRGPEGLAFDPRKGSLVVADASGLRIREVAGGPRTISTRLGDGTYRTLPYPVDVAVDAAGNLFVALPNGSNVLRQDASTGQLSVYAGGGSPTSGVGDGGPATAARLFEPRGVGVDAAGNLYIADGGGNRVRRVDVATRVITTVAGSGKGEGVYGGGDYSGDGGPATLADLDTPFDVAVDAAGNVFFVDQQNHRVRRVDRSSGTIATVAGSGPYGYAEGDFAGDGGPATQARLNYPTRLTFDGKGDLLIADSGNLRIRALAAATQVITTIAGNGEGGYSGDGGLATASSLGDPRGVAVDAAGNVYVAETRNNIVRVLPTSGCPLPLVTAQPKSQTIVSGFAVVLSVGISSPSAVTYQWYRGISGDTSSPVGGATAATYTTPPLAATARYWVRARNECGAVDSDTATVTVSGLLADLRLSLDASPEPVPVGGRLTTTFVVRNDGPTAATGVTLTVTLPAGVSLVSASAAQGTCSGSGPVTCALGALVQGAETRATVVVTPGATGAITTRGRVAGTEPDPDESNNSAQRTSTVSPATSADLSIGQSASPVPARAGGLVTFTLFVRNNGPAGATGIVVTDTLPSSATLVVASALLGTCSGTAPVTCAIGSLAAGVATTVTVIARANETGTLRNAVSVAAAQADPNPDNGSGALDVAVLPATAACPASAPDLVAWPDGVVRAGDTFTVSWSDVFGSTDPEGRYRAELASAPDFGAGSLLFETATRNLSVSYPTASSAAASTLHFRVTTVAGCGTPGPASRSVAISVAPSPPALVVTGPPSPEWTVSPGQVPPPATMTLRNVGGAATAVAFRASSELFTVAPASAEVGPGAEVSVTLTPLPGVSATPGTRAGSVTADWTVGSLTQTVFLTVATTTSQGSRPRVDQDEVLLVRAAAPGPAALAAETSSVTVTNSGSQPIFLVPSVSPGGAWLKLDPAQFSEPLGAGQSRVVSIGSDPSKVSPVDYPLPVFTVLTIAAAGGLPADQVQVKVFYTEGTPVVSGAGRGFLAPGDASFVVPTAVHKGGVGGSLFTSDGWVRNVSPDPVTFDVFVTPSGSDGQVEAQKVTQTMPGFSTLRLFDFIQALFGTTDLAGPVEIRSKDAAQLSVRTTASGLPGTGDAASRYGTEIAVYGGGTGTGVGLAPLVMTGIKDTPDWRLNLIVAETAGTAAAVTLRLFDSGGAELATRRVEVPALGNVQFRLVSELGLEGTAIEAASLVVEPAGGTGRVVAIGTLIDNASQSFQGLTGQVLATPPASTPSRAAAAAEVSPRVIPSIVHASGIGAFFTTELSITNGTATPATLRLVYDYAGSTSGTATADVTIPPRGSLPAAKSRDAVVSLFGLPPGSNTAGPLRIEGPGVGQVIVRATVTTPVDLADPSRGVKGSEFQSFSALSPEAVGAGSTPVAVYPGLQKYSGIRTNLILAEVSGRAARVRLRLVNGTTGGVLAEVDRSLAAWERVQVNDVWNGEGGFGVGDASLDKVAISVEPAGTEPGRVVSALSVIDNVTNSARILVLAPPGPPPPLGVGVGR